MKTKTILIAEEGKTQFDKAAKVLLKNREILAMILRTATFEFENMQIEEIARRIVDSKSKIPLTPALTNAVQITGQNTEDYVPYEGRIVFDNLLSVLLPPDDDLADMNIEIHNFIGTFEITTPRSVYYAARMISSEGDRDFSLAEQNYDEMHKVFSIWVILNTPEMYAGRILRYSLVPEFIYGEPYVIKGKYDLIEIIQITIGKSRPSHHDLIDFLFVLFSNTMKADEKIEQLTNTYGLHLNEDERKAVQDMEDLLEGLVQEAVNDTLAKLQAEADGKLAKLQAEAEEKQAKLQAELAEAQKSMNHKTLAGIAELIRNGKLSLDDAIAVFGFTEEDISPYLN